MPIICGPWHSGRPREAGLQAGGGALGALYYSQALCQQLTEQLYDLVCRKQVLLAQDAFDLRARSNRLRVCCVCVSSERLTGKPVRGLLRYGRRLQACVFAL